MHNIGFLSQCIEKVPILVEMLLKSDILYLHINYLNTFLNLTNPKNNDYSIQFIFTENELSEVLDNGFSLIDFAERDKSGEDYLRKLVCNYNLLYIELMFRVNGFCISKNKGAHQKAYIYIQFFKFEFVEKF